jgi:MFS family permease
MIRCTVTDECSVFLDGWFIKRKGLAFGVMWAGTGLAGVIFPLVIGASLERFGHRTTLRALSVFIFVLTMPLLHFVKARVPISITSPRRKRFDLSFLWSPTFVLFQGANVLQGLGSSSSDAILKLARS